MRCEEIIKILQQQSPEALACDWDNVGLLVGSGEKEVQRIYIALDATDETIAEAVQCHADLLLTHHPMIFKGIKKINQQDFIGRRVIELIRNDISYYAMHTNFDIAGMADLAAERLGLQETAVLQKTKETADGEWAGIGKTGKLPAAVSLEKCVELTKEAFEVDTVKVFGWQQSGKERTVSRAAVCPGSGKSVIDDALRAGAQVLITGDIDHHEGIDAAARGMAVIDAGHYGVEKIFIPYMEQYLKQQLPELCIFAQKTKQPFVYI